MSRREPVELTNLCMVYDDEGRILVEDRRDPDWPGLCFPGGHVERGESFVHSAIREVREETGLLIEQPRLCGVKQFQDDVEGRYVVFYFKTNRFSGQLHASSEGEVFWVKREELKNYTLCGDFLQMLQVFDSDEVSELYTDLQGSRSLL